MREIKFRSWHTEDKVMLQVGDKYGTTNLLDCCVYFMQGQPVELMQYTGLKDKNGKDIYEGDILVVEDTYKDRILDDGSGPTEPANHLTPVVFQDGSFGVDIKERGEDFDKGFWSFIGIQDQIGMALVEVIGNIYENPELVSIAEGETKR